MLGLMHLASQSMYWPRDMLRDFKNIRFQVGGQAISISVNQYRNNDRVAFNTPAKGGTQDAMVVKNALLSLDGAKILTRAGGASPYYSVFSGKASPESIATVLAMFHDYSDKFVARYGKTAGPARRCADWLADKHLSWQDKLQKISDGFIGLDCNGFVGNWLRRTDPVLKIGAETPVPSFFGRRKSQRKAIEDILAGDVVVWAHGLHVAVIDQEAPGGAHYHICQSAGGGPRRNEYVVRVSSPGKFRLSGGFPAGDVPGEVHICSLWH
jgi:hypothetical protein